MLAGVESLKGRSCKITVQCAASCRQEKAPTGMPSPWHTQETYISFILSLTFFFKFIQIMLQRGKGTYNHKATARVFGFFFWQPSSTIILHTACIS